MAQKAHSLSHTKWMCKYHIVFTPKYRRKVIYNQYRSSLGEIFHRLCSYKGVEIIEGHLMPDHVHMLVSILPRISIASFMGYLKAQFVKFSQTEKDFIQTHLEQNWSLDVIKGAYPDWVSCSMRTLYRLADRGILKKEDLPWKGKRKPNGHSEKRGK